MIAAAKTSRKAVAALLAAVAIGAALVPTAASARDHHGRNAAIFGGALLAGALLGAGSARGYDEPAYERECWTEKRTRYDAYGDLYVSRVRICD